MAKTNGMKNALFNYQERLQEAIYEDINENNDDSMMQQPMTKDANQKG